MLKTREAKQQRESGNEHGEDGHLTDLHAEVEGQQRREQMRAGQLHGGQSGLHPALTLHGVAALVAGVHVVPRTLLVGGGHLTVEERADPGAQVTDHEALPGARPGAVVAGPW